MMFLYCALASFVSHIVCFGESCRKVLFDPSPLVAPFLSYSMTTSRMAAGFLFQCQRCFLLCLLYMLMIEAAQIGCEAAEYMVEVIGRCSFGRACAVSYVGLGLFFEIIDIF